MDKSQQEIDREALLLAKAIAKVETQGQKDPYNAKGASGETGAYQFMPATWKEWSGKHLGDSNAPMTMENQNKVAYAQIKKWKDDGYTPAQVLSAWNSGRPDAYKTQKAGVNKQGVKHDVAGYVAKGSQAYRELLGAESAEAQVMPSEAQNAPSDVSLNPEQPDTRSGLAKFVGGILRPVGRVAANVMATTELAGALGNQEKFDEISKQRKQFGYNLPLVGNVTPFGTQGFGQGGVKEAVGVGAETASLLPMARGVTKATELGTKGLLRRGAIVGAQEGLGGGALQGFGEALQNDRGVGGTIVDTVMGGIAGGLGGAGLGAGFAGAGSAFSRLTKPLQDRVKNTVIELGNKVLRPSVKGRQSSTQVTQANDRMFEGFQTIYDNLDRLNITDEAGQKIAYPRNIPELQSAVEQSRNIIFNEYNEMAKLSGEAGMRIDVTPIITGLQREINNVANSPTVRNYYRQLSKEIAELNGQTPEVISARIADLNQSFPQFMQNRVDKGKARADLSVANKLRELMDEGIERYSGPGWQQLRKQYGALKEIEKDLSRRAIIEARKNNKGFFDLTDVFSGGQLAEGIVGLDPASLASSFAMRGVKGYIKGLNDPNRMVNKIFKEMDKAYRGNKSIQRTPSRLPQKQLEAPKTDVRSSKSDKGILRMPRRTQSTIDKAEQAVVKRPTRGGGIVETVKKKAKNVIEDIKKNGQKGSAELLKNTNDRLNGLKNEARKYKNIEDFIDSLDISYEDSWKGQKNKNADNLKKLFAGRVFHGTNASEEIIKNGYKKDGYFNSGVYFSDTPDISIGYMKQNRGTGKSQDVLVNDLSNLKIKQGEGSLVRKISKSDSGMEELVKTLKKQGFDGVKDETGETLVWNVEKIKKPETLKGIWNKANKNNADDALIQEARKYKSAEEFVKEQGTQIYHGTDKVFKEFDIKKTPDGSIWFTDNKNSIIKGDSGASGSTRIIDRFINENELKLADWNAYDKYSLDQLQNMGYDGIKFSDTGDGRIDYQIFYPEKLKTKSQLEEIWNKANKKSKGKAQLGAVAKIGLGTMGLAGGTKVISEVSKMADKMKKKD